MESNKSTIEPPIPTPTVGEILQEEFLKPMNITPYRLAKELHVSTSTALDLIHGKRRLSTDMALRLSRYFDMSDKFWINLQGTIDVRTRKPKLEQKLEEIRPIHV